MASVVRAAYGAGLATRALFTKKIDVGGGGPIAKRALPLPAFRVFQRNPRQVSFVLQMLFTNTNEMIK